LQSEIVDYEDYDYREFWKGKRRNYENLSEVFALKKLIFKNGIRFIDIGGGYGRLSGTYINLFPQVFLLDYSLKNLSLAREKIYDKSKSKIFFIRSDAYNIPFGNSTFDFAISIRVIHHINQPEKFLNEVYRILKPKGIFVLEYANKRNLKRIGKFLIGRGSENPFLFKPTLIGKNIYNFHPKFIEDKLQSAGFKILKILSVSNFRLNILKKIISPEILSKIDNLVQSPLGLLKTGPSIFVLSQKKDKKIYSKKQYFKKENIKSKYPFEETMCSSFDLEKITWRCTNCGSNNINEEENELTCMNCNFKFAIRDGIYDFKINK
jgi:ubiquinone/menaquinone biosynthesis C-methylase UbiE/uncharacterized protein YbaR (Trm112 family)